LVVLVEAHVGIVAQLTRESHRRSATRTHPSRSPGGGQVLAAREAVAPPSSTSFPVIRRAPRPCVAKLNIQRMNTITRFWKPTRYQRCTTTQVTQARK